MQSLKSVFGVIGALFPVVYCAGLFYYFFGVAGSVEEAKEIGLAPTLLGLGAVGLLFCIPLAPASGAESLANMSKEDLLGEYCERMAAAFQAAGLDNKKTDQ